MKAIWKYPIEVTDRVVINMPKGAKVLTVAVQRGEVCVWALVDPQEPKCVAQSFRIYGTGHPVALNPGVYIGTFQLAGGNLVFHLFQEQA